MPSTAVATSVADLVLAIHPTSRGFGWIVFESPLAPVDWGIATAETKRPTKLFTRFERIIDKYQPSVLALENFEGGQSRRTPRIQHVARSIVSLAHVRGLYVPIYSREAVHECFSRFGATGRHEIAEIIARHIEVLARTLPKKRRAWESEKPNQSIFDAAAVALTFYASHGDWGT